MSKADNKELEEAIKVLQKFKEEINKLLNIRYINNNKTNNTKEKSNAIEIVLKELEILQEENKKHEEREKFNLSEIMDSLKKLTDEQWAGYRYFKEREELKKEYLEKIKQKQEEYNCDYEARHIEEDNMLCELLTKIDFEEIVDQYIKTEKWYA